MMDASEVDRPVIRMYGDWKPWFAWYPIIYEGKTVWLEKIYRRQSNGWVSTVYVPKYQYTDLFGMMKK